MGHLCRGQESIHSPDSLTCRYVESLLIISTYHYHFLLCEGGCREARMLVTLFVQGFPRSVSFQNEATKSYRGVRHRVRVWSRLHVVHE
jgi:hypothetical protein